MFTTPGWMRWHTFWASPSNNVDEPLREAMSTPLVDTHCHIDLYPDPSWLIRDSENRQIYTIAVTNTPSVFLPLAEIIGASKYVRPALGLHPELAAARHRELPIFAALLDRTRYVGEVGLDYQTKDEADRAVQRRVLSTIIDQCDAAGGKVLTVHSRRAANDVVDAFGTSFNGAYILHWFSGGVKVLRRALTNGAFISVNPAMVRSRTGRALIGEAPRDRVLTETDGPFVTTGDHPKVKPAVPDDVRTVIAGLRELWDVAHDEAAQQVYANFCSLLRK